MFKEERTVNTFTKNDNRDEVTVRLLAYPRKAVFGALLNYANGKGWKPGWAAWCFKEVFGGWPVYADRGPPCGLPDFVIEEWLARRKNPQRRIKLEKPAPLIDSAPATPVEVNADGFVPGTLMTPEDLAEDWR